jgi:hypothetical protein
MADDGLYAQPASSPAAAGRGGRDRPGRGLQAGGDGGLAAVQLVRLRAASQGQVAEAFGVDPATVWR